MTRVSHNIVANMAGRVWGALMNFAFVPVYVGLMGVESFGLVGAFASLTVVLSVVDLGLSTVLNRELARSSASEKAAATARHLVRTLEYVYWATGAVLGLIIAVSAPLAARHWLKSEHLPIASVTQAVLLMGAVVAFQWPSSLYSGGLLGLQRQVALNVVTIAVSTLRGVGASLVLWLISPTIQAFFIWQIVVSGVQTTALGITLWRSLDRSGEKPAFKVEVLRGNWRFAAGIAGISLASVLLTQLDKVVLSRLLSLTMFGYYSIAGAVGFGIASVASPVFAAVFPKMTQLTARGDEAGLAQLYHKSCQLVAMMVVPMAIGIAIFSPDLLELWLGDRTTVRETQALLSVLTMGTMLNSLVLLPYALQLSNGWTRLSLIKNVVALAAFVPGLLVMTHRWGGLGAAGAWVLLNFGYVVFEVPIMHRRLLKGQLARWYLIDVGLPIAVVSAVVVPGRLLMPDALSLAARAAWMGSTVALALAAAVLALPAGRAWVAQALAGPTSRQAEAR